MRSPLCVLPPPPRGAALAMGLALALALAAGCPGPRLDPFDDRTQVLCPGEDGAIAFRGEGDLILAVRIDDPRLAPAPGEAPAGLAPDTVTVTLVAGDKARKVSFLKVAGSWDETVAFRASPQAGELVASGEKSAAWWGDPKFEVTRVAAAGRALEVRHAGRSARLAADGAPSDALAGTPLAGSWELRAALTDDERSGRAPPPGSLRVVATARCRGTRP